VGGLAKGSPPWRVVFSRVARHDLKQLRKPCPNIDTDLHSLLEGLERNPEMGEECPGTEPLCRKVRAKSRDMRKGRSGAFRIIFAVGFPDAHVVSVLRIYRKSDLANLAASEITRLAKEWAKEQEAANAGTTEQPPS
jgi:mRNA-degrading endonuclease RelE of RelBE toxin-antitoxin system